MPINMKESIADAFVRLMTEKDVNKITVKDLVEVCAISRQSFYYHFRDLNAVVVHLIRRYLWACADEVRSLETLAESVHRHWPEWTLLLRYGGGRFTEQAVKEELAGWLRELAEAPCSGVSVRASDAAVWYRFCAGGMAELLLPPSPDLRMPPRELAGLLEMLLCRLAAK